MISRCIFFASGIPRIPRVTAETAAQHHTIVRSSMQNTRGPTRLVACGVIVRQPDYPSNLRWMRSTAGVRNSLRPRMSRDKNRSTGPSVLCNKAEQLDQRLDLSNRWSVQSRQRDAAAHSVESEAWMNHDFCGTEFAVVNA